MNPDNPNFRTPEEERRAEAFVKAQETIAELRAEVERLTGEVVRRNQYKLNQEMLDVAHKVYEDRIACQTRVIEIAKRVLYNAGLRPPDGGTPTVETICEDLNDAIKEIAAIERAEGEKDAQR